MSYNLVDPTTGDLTRVAGGNNINDETTSTSTTWSSKKINDSLDGKVVVGRITVPRGDAKSTYQALKNADDYIITISIVRVIDGVIVAADKYQLYDPLVVQGYGNGFFVQIYLKPGVTDPSVTDKDTLTYNWIAVKKAN